MSKRKRPSTRGIKSIMYQIYGKRCMICEKRKDKLQYHHIIEFAEGGETTIENGGLICDRHHKELHLDNQTKERYNRKIRSYKAKIDFRNSILNKVALL